MVTHGRHSTNRAGIASSLDVHAVPDMRSKTQIMAHIELKLAGLDRGNAAYYGYVPADEQLTSMQLQQHTS